MHFILGDCSGCTTLRRTGVVLSVINKDISYFKDDDDVGPRCRRRKKLLHI